MKMNCTVDVDKLANFMFAIQECRAFDFEFYHFLIEEFYSAVDVDTSAAILERVVGLTKIAEQNGLIGD